MFVDVFGDGGLSICRWEEGIFQEKTILPGKSWKRPVSIFIKEVYSRHQINRGVLYGVLQIVFMVF